jgi:hypothetical protein
MKTVIFLCGIHSFAFALFHAFFWKIFKWKEDLKSSSLPTRAIIQITNLRLIYLFAAVGTICFAYPDEILSSRLGNAFLIMMSLFWAGRLIEQFIFLRHNRAVIHVLSAAFLAGSVLFAYPLFKGTGIFAAPGEWQMLGGTARFQVEDGVLTGDKPATYLLAGDNTFYASKKSYANFILEVEYKLTPGANSGIQFRSRYDEKLKNVTGYQFELDHGGWPNPLYWTGAIYEEKGRGWIFPPGGKDDSLTAKVRPLLKLTDWNRVRIEAIGPRLKTFVNGVMIADVEDRAASSGFIAFQVHATVNPFSRDKVMFRNFKIEELP